MRCSGAAILTTDKFKGVRMVLATGSLKITSTNADQEEAQEELEIDYTGDGWISASTSTTSSTCCSM